MSKNIQHDKLVTKILVMDSGERVVLIINSKTAIPHLELNRYLFHVRKPTLAFKSLRKEGVTICLIYNLTQQILGDWSSYDLLNKVNSKKIFKIWEELKNSSVKDEISLSTHMYRWDIFKKLFDYWADQQILNATHNDPQFKNLIVKKKIILKEILRLRLKSSQNRLTGLDKNVIEEILFVTRQNSLNNPWIKRDRLRNELVVDILLKLGLRAGELLKISLDNVKLSSQYPTITIKRILNDIDDPRKDEPRVKTFGRILEIDTQLANNISLYLKERRQIASAKKTKYLFVSHTTGRPLSDDGLRLILKSIKLKNYHKSITPHDFRRTWNDLFRESAEDSGIDSEIVTQTQNYLQGRMLDSKEAYKYSAKYIEKTAREAHMRLQNDLLKDNT